MTKIASAILLTFALVGPAHTTGVAGAGIQGVASVVDADTLDIHGMRIRLHGVDAPESSQTCRDEQGIAWRCGQRAALALSDKIGRQPVSCLQTDTDRYGRVVAECFLAGESLNSWLVREGWAVAYRSYSTAYVADEDHARRARRGVWTSEFDMPWDWRKTRRTNGQSPAPLDRLMQLSQRGHSCSPRKTCKAIDSCDEAMWYLENCSWGGRLDRDNDGIPCESIC